MSLDDRLPYLFFLAKKISDPAASKDDQLHAAIDFFEAVVALADDTTVTPEDRWLACELQAVASSHASHHTGAILAALSEVAASETADPEDRDKARQLIEHAAKTLRWRGTDISKWTDPGTARLQ
jgi:hypothetical protein